MNLDHFSAAVDAILARDARFERDAYLFVRDALDFTTKQQRKRTGVGGASERHVSSQELLEGVRQHALAQYGPMVPTVFEHWGVRSSADIGSIVFNLIDAREFGKAEHDRLEDFQQGLDFHEAFVLPFRSSARKTAVLPRARRSSAPASKPI